MIAQVLNPEDIKKVTHYHPSINECLLPIRHFLITSGSLLFFPKLFENQNTTLMIIIGLVIIGGATISFIRNSSKLKNERYKLIGRVTITKKVRNDINSYTFFLDNERVKSIVVDESAFNRFNRKDTIYLEVTQQTKLVLQIEKDCPRTFMI
jgi:hypothetical protein